MKTSAAKSGDTARFHDLLGRYTQVVIAQMMQSTACNALHQVPQRCARWLLMTHDRMHEQDFHLSHEFLAVMLGVQRPTVSVVAGTLQEAGLIRYKHGRVTVRDRKGLEAAACECYAIIRAHFDRLRTVSRLKGARARDCHVADRTPVICFDRVAYICRRHDMLNDLNDCGGHHEDDSRRAHASPRRVPGDAGTAPETRTGATSVCVERTLSQMMLDALVNEGFLCVGSDGRYARLTTELAHPAHADVEPSSVAKPNGKCTETRHVRRGLALPL